MDNSLLLSEIISNQKAFKTLDQLSNKSIQLNSISVNILGIHFMNNGTNWHVIKHKHSFFEFHYILKGQVYTTLDKTIYKVTEGESYIIPPGVAHAHEQKDGIGHVGIALRFEFNNETVESNSLIKKIITASSPIPCHNKFQEILINLLHMTQLQSSELEMKLMMLHLILNIGKDLLPDTSSLNKTDYDVHHHSIAKQAIRFIEENYMEDIRVDDVATSVYLSYSQLARIFKKHIGVTVNHYINQYRINQAKLILMNSDNEIKYIASTVGFNSEYYFCNAFKNFEGISPSRYRDDYKH